MADGQTLFRLFFNDFTFFIYGIAIFLLINHYKKSTKNFNWIAIILTGISTAVLYTFVVLLVAENVGEAMWVGITGLPTSLIGGLISAFLTNLVIFLIKKYKS